MFVRDELLRLMQKFFLTYEVEHTGAYIVPERLPPAQPTYEWAEKDNLFWRYQYDFFMPKGIISQFTVQMNRYIRQHHLVWRRGVVLERDHTTAEIIEVYEGRRDVMVKGLREIGLEVDRPKATFYLWIQVPRGYTSAQFTTLLLEQAGIVATPGNGFGEGGEGYFRMALTVDVTRLKEAIERLKRIKF